MKKLQLKDAGKFIAMLMCALFISFSFSSCGDDDDPPAPSEILKAWELNMDKAHAAGMPSSFEGLITDLREEGALYQWAKIEGEWQLVAAFSVKIHFNSDGTSGTLSTNENVEELKSATPLKGSILPTQYEFRKFNGKSIEVKLNDIWVPAKASKVKLPDLLVK